MLIHKPYNDREAQEQVNCFKEFYEESNFEYILNRWAYTEENEYDDLDKFFDEFHQEFRIKEFFKLSNGIIRRKDEFQRTQNSWQLYRLRKNMFMWDNFGRGIDDLFIWGSLEFGGFMKEGKTRAKEFKELLTPIERAEIVYYSTLMCEYAQISPDRKETNPIFYQLAIKSQNLSGLHNLDYKKNFPPKKGSISFISPWLDRQLRSHIIILHNKTYKEIIFWIITNYA
ncbi:MAG: hypothetical protein LBJ25_07840 [Candidatus Margulisbacteria bacterium]|jgi:hypothetical protein|nr:hypothetical protein [Candidatus Margulisiibacteriota bacterium]